MDSKNYDQNVDFASLKSLVIVDKIDGIQCVFCKALYRKQFRLECNHYICRNCKYIRLKRCPICNYDVESKSMICDLEQQIRKLRVRCANRDCEFQDTMSNFEEKHKICQFSKPFLSFSTKTEIQQSRQPLSVNENQFVDEKDGQKLIKSELIPIIKKEKEIGDQHDVTKPKVEEKATQELSKTTIKSASIVKNKWNVIGADRTNERITSEIKKPPIKAKPNYVREQVTRFGGLPVDHKWKSNESKVSLNEAKLNKKCAIPNVHLHNANQRNSTLKPNHATSNLTKENDRNDLYEMMEEMQNEINKQNQKIGKLEAIFDVDNSNLNEFHEKLDELKLIRVSEKSEKFSTNEQIEKMSELENSMENFKSQMNKKLMDLEIKRNSMENNAEMLSSFQRKIDQLERSNLQMKEDVNNLVKNQQEIVIIINRFDDDLNTFQTRNNDMESKLLESNLQIDIKIAPMRERMDILCKEVSKCEKKINEQQYLISSDLISKIEDHFNGTLEQLNDRAKNRLNEAQVMNEKPNLKTLETSFKLKELKDDIIRLEDLIKLNEEKGEGNKRLIMEMAEIVSNSSENLEEINRNLNQKNAEEFELMTLTMEFNSKVERQLSETAMNIENLIKQVEKIWEDASENERKVDQLLQYANEIDNKVTYDQFIARIRNLEEIVLEMKEENIEKAKTMKKMEEKQLDLAKFMFELKEEREEIDEKLEFLNDKIEEKADVETIMSDFETLSSNTTKKLKLNEENFKKQINVVQNDLNQVSHLINSQPPSHCSTKITPTSICAGAKS